MHAPRKNVKNARASRRRCARYVSRLDSFDSFGMAGGGGGGQWQAACEKKPIGQRTPRGDPIYSVADSVYLYTRAARRDARAAVPASLRQCAPNATCRGHQQFGPENYATRHRQLKKTTPQTTKVIF